MLLLMSMQNELSCYFIYKKNEKMKKEEEGRRRKRDHSQSPNMKDREILSFRKHTGV